MAAYLEDLSVCRRIDRSIAELVLKLRSRFILRMCVDSCNDFHQNTNSCRRDLRLATQVNNHRVTKGAITSAFVGLAEGVNLLNSYRGRLTKVSRTFSTSFAIWKR